jgi:enoyl-CoA hydratase/carnithine racemase
LRWVQIESSGDGLRVLTLNRPPVNALSRDLVEDIGSALSDLARDEEARCLIVRSALRHFCAGADLGERQGMPVDEVRRVVRRLSAVVTQLADLPFPTVAAIRGAAVGGGCEIALACDSRILAEDATLGLRETALAVIPGAGGTQRLPRLIGPGRAKRWIFTARAHTAHEALSDGAAEKIVPADRLDAEARRFAETILQNGPVALRMAKRAVDGGLDLPIAEALEFEWDCYEAVLHTEDRIEALAAFADKRPAKFRGR